MTELLWICVALFLGFAAGISIRRTREIRKDVGESRVINCIHDANLPLYHLINNITLPTSEGSTQIDHVLITDTAIFVIETKHYQGWIFGGPNQKQWTQTIYRKKSRFQNPLSQNDGHIQALRQLFKLPSESFVNLVVFSGAASLKTEMGESVIQLKDLISYISAFRPTIFDERKISYIVGRIEMKRLQRSIETDEYHINRLASKYSNTA